MSAAEEKRRHPNCGGTILVGGLGKQRHHYCDRCHAFAYGDAEVPSGTDRGANQAAWNNQDEESPAAGYCAKCESFEHRTEECDDLHAPREEYESVESELGMRGVWS